MRKRTGKDDNLTRRERSEGKETERNGKDEYRTWWERSEEKEKERTGKDEYRTWLKRSEGKETKRNRNDEYRPSRETFDEKQTEKTAKRKVCTRKLKHWHKFTLFQTYVLRFPERIERLKTPLGNFLFQSESWNMFMWKNHFIQSDYMYAGNLCNSYLVDLAWKNKFRSFLVCCKTFVFMFLFKTFVRLNQSFQYDLFKCSYFRQFSHYLSEGSLRPLSTSKFKQL